MGNIATSTTQQIQKLTERGMILDFDDAKTKEILLDIGYYRLGFYWHPFEKNKEHNFQKDTKFSNVVSLYYLDVDLRNLLLKYINRIEINFRTKLVYYVSNKYKNSPTWFIDPKVMDAGFIAEIGKHYNESFKKNNKTILQHHRNNINDKYAPAWKTLEFFTFGTSLKIFKCLNEIDIKEKISDEYGIKNLSKFTNIMETIVYVRNTCAHGGVLFDFQTPRGIAVLPHVHFNNNDRHCLDSAIKITLCILQQISPNRKNEMENSIRNLFIKYIENQTLKSIIEEKIGFIFD
jgi:abortive infection bacteriophage resistance protein